MIRTLANFDEFVATNAAVLVRAAYLLVGDEREAEDLVQECLIKLAKRWGRIGAMEHPLAYARRVLVNLTLDGSKRRSRQRSELHQTEYELRGATPLQPTEFESRDELFEALRALPPSQRATLVLRFFLDLSEAETARSLGCSVGSVKSNGAKGLARLRELLGERAPQSEVRER